MELEYKGEKVKLVKSQYMTNKNTALLMVVAADNEPYMTISVNIPVDLSPDIIAVKDYSENEGVLDWLVDNNIVDCEGQEFSIVGHAGAQRAKIIGHHMISNCIVTENGGPYEWTKKLGQQHYSAAQASSTLCGMPMLGNNYAKHLNNSEKTMCPTCWAALYGRVE